LTAENIRDIITFCAERQIVVMADEVYQENIYNPAKPFVSFRKVLKQLQEQNNNKFKVIGGFGFCYFC
jgi:alanine transaminase